MSPGLKCEAPELRLEKPKAGEDAASSDEEFGVSVPAGQEPDAQSSLDVEALNQERNASRERQQNIRRASKLIAEQSITSTKMMHEASQLVPPPGESPRSNLSSRQLSTPFKRCPSGRTLRPTSARNLLASTVPEPVQQRKSVLLEVFAQQTKMMEQRMLQIDVQVNERLRNRRDDMMKKAYASQQRRNEQQKAFRELQKEKERIWSNLRDKHHKELRNAHMSMSAQQLTRSNPADEAQTKLFRRAAESAGNLPVIKKALTCSVKVSEEVGNEQVFSKMLESHDMYAKKIDEWRQFVIENEHRTNAYWIKMVGSGHQRYIESTNTSTLVEAPKASLRKRVHTVHSAMSWYKMPKQRGYGGQRPTSSGEKKSPSRNSPVDQRPLSGGRPWSGGRRKGDTTRNGEEWSPSNGSPVGQRPLSGHSPLSGASKNQITKGGEELEEMDDTSGDEFKSVDPSMMSGTSYPLDWKEKRLRALDHLEHCDEAREAKWRNMETQIGDACNRRENLNLAIKEKAKRRGMELDERLKKAHERRAEEHQANDEVLMERQKESEERREATARLRDEESQRRSKKQEESVLRCRQFGAKRVQEFRDKARDGLEAKEAAKQNLLSLMEEKLQHATFVKAHENEAAIRLAMKKERDDAFRHHTSEEGREKELRSLANLARTHMSTVEKDRLKARELRKANNHDAKEGAASDSDVDTVGKGDDSGGDAHSGDGRGDSLPSRSRSGRNDVGTRTGILPSLLHAGYRPVEIKGVAATSETSSSEAYGLKALKMEEANVEAALHLAREQASRMASRMKVEDNYEEKFLKELGACSERWLAVVRDQCWEQNLKMVAK